MNKSQKRRYLGYIQNRSLAMPLEDYRDLINLYNELFKEKINFDTFIKSSGVIHKINKIETKIEKKWQLK